MAADPPAPLDPPLSPGERQALEGLALKKTGAEVRYVNIADARSLTDRGLAARSQQGWTITAAGEAVLRTLTD